MTMKRLLLFVFYFCLLLGILTGCSDSSHKASSPPCFVQMERNGIVYEEYAVQGQVWLLMEDDITSNEAAQFFREYEARIIDSQPEIGYYLVAVKPGTEGEFIAEMQDCLEVDYVYPNAIYEEHSVTPYVIDNFVGTHGPMVSQMMEEASLKNVVEKDISIFLGGGRRIDDDKVKKHLRQILGNGTNKGKNNCVINMSFGPGLGRNKQGERQIWTDEDVTDAQKNGYINRCVSDMCGLVKYIHRYYRKSDIILGKDDDFVIVKAAGNEGMKTMDIILEGISDELSWEETNFFKDHFLYVSARDDHKFENINRDYTNDVYEGGCHEMFSKVDISDKTITSKDWTGTSFAAPRLAGYIVRAANQFDMPVTEVLPYVRLATKKAPDHVIDYELIEKEIKLEGIDPFNDLIGQTIKDPSENGYFGSSWSWTLERDEVMYVSEISRKNVDQNSIEVTVFARLLHGELEVDATIAIIYKKTRHDPQFSHVRTLDLIIPEQTDYSQYIDVKNEGDFSTIEVYNNSPYKLFVVGDYVPIYRESRRFVTIIEPGDSATVAVFTIMESYNIRFAYRM